MISNKHKLCIAPMMTHTDRHFRYLLRLISRHVMLYTEMITTGALLYGNSRKQLAFHPAEHPIGIQLGGSDPEQLSQCARIAQAAAYDEINLNIGCPSDRVQSGQFGACLMAEPDLVAECVAAMQSRVQIPITVKTRIGIDEQDSYAHLKKFVHTVAEGGCKTFIIHARKAWLNGLSPKQNREIPPLKYEVVHRIKKDFPHIEVIINGGFTSIGQIQSQYQHIDGVMIGRAVCNNPYLLAEAEQKIFDNEQCIMSRREILDRYTSYIKTQLAKGEPFSRMTQHIFGLFQGQQGAKAYRRYLSEQISRGKPNIEVIEQAMNLVKAA